MKAGLGYEVRGSVDMVWHREVVPTIGESYGWQAGSRCIGS